ncbi:hypothetical protein A9995_04800 [Erythrobacter sp. QSSC1-22B]|uniref:hypothetical protein n=1 Tax=Erythrobacter sp. QSSC1-22B TaxID=1860125 RepID=UPI000805926D|nr:hypothetical protein [Erythrobacter sp. QSSC1-22B]OBX19876.1 hypothetical protein A9995_04800 [Erythrobacter sp. QSSC1-22B]
MNNTSRSVLLPLVACLAMVSGPLSAQDRPSVAAPALATGPTYAALVDLAERAPLVVRARIKQQAQVSAERAPGLAPGFARLYIEAETLALLSGDMPIGESLRYLVDVPLDSRGKPPKLRKQEVLLFARPVPNRPREVQLVYPRAQLVATPELETRLRPVLTQLASADRPPVVTGVRDVLSIAGTLTGESETQLFLDTANDGPVSVTVVRRPGMEPRWGVSWTEIVDQAARPPEAGTLAWYRLACALPERLPAEANLARDEKSRARAVEDYALVMASLGPCERNRS